MLGVLVLLPGLAWGQGEQNGAIAGTVRDTTGAVLPGVTVEVTSPALIEKARSAVTDGQGQYRIVDLRPGVYAVTFVLTGFSTVRREGIGISTGFTATASAELPVGAVGETITVSGASPTVDVQNVRAQTIITRQVLDTLPIARDFNSYTAATPGASSTDQRSVGGTKGEGNSGLLVHGAGSGHTMQDGLMVESPISGGTGRGYFTSQALIQEVVLYTTASAETEAGGLNVNMVTKDGGNSVIGTGSFVYAGESLQNSNLTDELRARGVSTPNTLRQVYDFGGGVGGPIKRDAVWFYAGARKWGSEETVAGLFYNKLPPGSLFYEPDLDRPALFPNKYYDTSVKVTGLLAKHKITVSDSQQYKCNCYIQLGNTALNAPAVRTPEATSHSRAPWKSSYVRTATWNYPASNRLLLEAGWGMRRQDTYFQRPDEVPADARSVADLGLGLEYGAKFNGPFGSWLIEQGRGVQIRHNARFAVSHITGSHALKVGFSKAWGSITINAQPNYPVQFIFRNRVPIGVNQIAAPHTEDNRLKAQDAIFAQDQWTIRRLTLNLGLRFDHHNAYNPAQVLQPTDFTPEFRFDPKYNLPNWNDISPRLGAAYDLFGTSKTAVKVYVGRYVIPEALTLSQNVNPANAISTFTTRTWDDLNGNYSPDCDLRSPLGNGECGPMANQRFGTQVATTRYADDVLLGWGVRPYSWQTSVALQHELLSNVSVTAAYFRTSQRNVRVTDNAPVSPEDYDPFCVAVPADPRLPGGGGNQLCGLYDVRPAKFGQVDNVVTQAKNFGERTEVFNGVDLTINARFREGGLLAGGVSFGRTSIDECSVNPDSPMAVVGGVLRSYDFCRSTPPWTNETRVKLAAAYSLPWRFIASGTYQNLPGTLQQANVVFSNAQIVSSLGRNLAACGTRVPCTATVNVQVTEQGALAEPRQNQLDVRLARMFQMGRLRIKPLFDVYNLFNASPVLRVNNTFNALWPRPTDLLGGRLFKFGADLDF